MQFSRIIQEVTDRLLPLEQKSAYTEFLHMWIYKPFNISWQKASWSSKSTCNHSARSASLSNTKEMIVQYCSGSLGPILKPKKNKGNILCFVIKALLGITSSIHSSLRKASVAFSFPKHAIFYWFLEGFHQAARGARDRPVLRKPDSLSSQRCPSVPPCLP